MSLSIIRVVFGISAVYDFVLGIVFLVIPGTVYSLYSVPPPNHMGYVQFPALLIGMFGVMYFMIAKDPSRYRILIPYGIFLKVAYSFVVFYYWGTSGIPSMWKPFAVIDSIFAILFYVALKNIKKE